MTTFHVESKPLPSGADTEAGKIAAWLLSKDADFQIYGDVKVCNNTKGLVAVTSDLFKMVVNEILYRIPYQAMPLDNRVAAIYFNRPTIVPVGNGWMVDLIPIHADGAVTVGDLPLELNSYIQLTDQSCVSGNFFGEIFSIASPHGESVKEPPLVSSGNSAAVTQ